MAQRVHESREVRALVEDFFSYWSNFETFARIVEFGGQPDAEPLARFT